VRLLALQKQQTYYTQIQDTCQVALLQFMPYNDSVKLIHKTKNKDYGITN
jgi:hypothetical protein